MIGRALVCCVVVVAGGMTWAAEDPVLPMVGRVARQPLVAQVRGIVDAMEVLGTPLPEANRKMLEAGIGLADDAQAVTTIQSALDPLCLLAVEINPEARVKVAAGPAKAELVEQGWRTFLVKVHNAAGITGEIKASSPQAIQLANSQAEQVIDRWLDLSAFTGRPLSPKLSGLELEYRVIQLYSRDPGKRSATLTFDAGQGTQDLGFRSDVQILFDALPAQEVTFKITDETGQPTTAGLVIKDKQGHVYPS